MPTNRSRLPRATRHRRNPFRSIDMRQLASRRPSGVPRAPATSASNSPVTSPTDETSQFINQLLKETNYQEDSDEFTPTFSDASSIDTSKKKASECDSSSAGELLPKDHSWIKENCFNCTNTITSDPFSPEEFSQICSIFIADKNGRFIKGTCITKSDVIETLKSELRSDLNTPELDPSVDAPTNLMSIWTTPKNPMSVRDLQVGMTSVPTGRLVFRLPVAEIYTTLGSLKRLLDSSNKKWYALPLFGGKRRRIGNLLGIHGSSMHHGQIEGFKVYKLFTPAEIASGVTAVESRKDYPLSLYMHQSTQPLMDIIGYNSQNIYKHFYTSVIKSLLAAANTDDDF